MSDRTAAPTIDAVRVIDWTSFARPTPLLVFDCPHCWKYGGSHGYDDMDCGGFYRRRPKRARPVRHVHGAGANPGDGDGHRVAHYYGGPR